MLSWEVGRVKITRIVEMDLPVPATVIRQATAEELRKLAWLYPHFVSGDDTTLNLSVHALLVEAPGLKLVVDTCIGNDRPREITGGQPLATPFLQHLGDAGWSRDAVDAAVCTHLHPLRRPHRRPRHPRRRSLQVCGVRAASPHPPFRWVRRFACRVDFESRRSSPLWHPLTHGVERCAS
jgi:hypothetical protein